MRTLSIIIPCYNERATVRALVERVLALSPQEWKIQVVAVDDASTDGTADILASFGDRIALFRHQTNQGKGSAVATGIRHASGDFILIQDADLEYAPEEIPALLAEAKSEDSVVFGSRNLHATKREGFIIPRLGVWLITALINSFYGSRLTDVWTCYKLFPARLKQSFSAGRFESEIAFTIAVLEQGYRIVEVPISHTPRDRAHGKKIRYRDGLIALGLILRSKFGRVSRFVIAGSLGTLANIIILYVFSSVFGLWYIAAGVLSFVLSSGMSFVLQKTWTFKDRSVERVHAKAIKYFAVAAVNLCINTLLLYVFVDYCHIYYLVSQIIASGLIAFESYCVYRAFIFESQSAFKRRGFGAQGAFFGIAFAVVSLALACSSVGFLKPQVVADSPSYIQSIGVLDGAHPPTDFIPNRILTSFGALKLVDGLSRATGDIPHAWLLLNVCLYIAFGGALYMLLRRIFASDRVAFLGGLFCIGSYGAVVFGLNYMMDVGGWMFYALSLWFLYSYSQSRKTRDLILSALMVGIGGLFKEYAFLGAVALGAFVVLDSWPSVRAIAKRALMTAPVALAPVALVYVFVYARFGYTYADWFAFNHSYYVYASRAIEYIKASGSLVNFLAFAFLAGAYALVREWKGIDIRLKRFFGAWAISIVPILFWPAITQRILFITVPFISAIACFAFKRYEKRWYIFAALLVLYVLAAFFMDSYILKAVSLPF